MADAELAENVEDPNLLRHRACGHPAGRRETMTHVDKDGNRLAQRRRLEPGEAVRHRCMDCGFEWAGGLDDDVAAQPTAPSGPSARAAGRP